MVNLIKDKIQELQTVCMRHHVKTFYLIGSATSHVHFSNDSDIDFLYKFAKTEIPEMDYADNYFSLLFTLQDLLKRKVDLVSEEKISNPYFLNSINKQKEVIYES